MFPAINLGPLVLPTAAFTFIIGIWASLTVAERSARRLGIDPDLMVSLVTYGLVAGFVGARLTFVILYWPAYQNNLLGIVWPLNSGFSPWGGLFFGGAAMFFYGRYKQLPADDYLDALAPVLVTALLFASLADFLGGPGFGTFTNAPWGIENFGIRRHPVQLYEIGVAIAALLAWWLMLDRRAFEGQLFLVTMAVYCFGRLFVDAFRANTWILSGGWHGLQILCLLGTLAAVFLLLRRQPVKGETAV
jgi:phosphatidylglycerol---prolipoprotein diacylglyceryl transferase